MKELRPDSAETQRLLEEVGDPQSEAFSLLFARHRPYLRRVISLRLDPRLRPRVDASDIIQETQLEALRRLQDFLKREPMSFRLWLRKIACERLLMARRQHLTANRRSVAREEPLADASSAALTRHFLAPGSTPSHKLGRHELVEQVRQAIARLAQTDREIVVMRNLELLTNHEVAQILGIDPAAASQRYGRALLKLRKLLTERGLAEVEL